MSTSENERERVRHTGVQVWASDLAECSVLAWLVAATKGHIFRY